MLSSDKRAAIFGSPQARIGWQLSPARPGRQYYPNREKWVVLECGCLNTWWLAVHHLGEAWYQSCPKHENPPHEWGWKVLREASTDEYLIFFLTGNPIPARRSKRTYKDVLGMSGCDADQATRNRHAQQSLF